MIGRFIDNELKGHSGRSKGRRNVLFNQLTDEVIIKTLEKVAIFSPKV